MKLKNVSAWQGLKWVQTGLSLAAAQPLGFVGLLGFVLTWVMLLMMLPMVGAVVLIATMPVVWLLFMLATQQAMRGERVNPWLLMRALQQSLREPHRPRQWAVLGGLYVLATLLVMLLASLLGPDLDTLAQALDKASDNPTPDLLNDPVLVQSMLWHVGLTWPVALMFWHTPALIHGGHATPLKALFFSTVVCWRNLGAFVCYALGWAALILALGLPLQWLGSVLGPGLAMQCVSIGLGLWVVSAFYASLYATVADCLTLIDPAGHA